MNASAMEAAAGSSPSVVTLTLGPTSLMSAALQLEQNPITLAHSQ
jgi:hypothetical protein